MGGELGTNSFSKETLWSAAAQALAPEPLLMLIKPAPSTPRL